MAEAALSACAVAGSVCGDPRRLQDVDDMLADGVSPIENKRPRMEDDVTKPGVSPIGSERPRMDDDVTKPARKNIMGEENPEYPYECRNWRGYARGSGERLQEVQEASNRKRTYIDQLNSISPRNWLFRGVPWKRSRHADAM